jgi:uncharacterized protein YjbI with pentapeptide repeats
VSPPGPVATAASDVPLPPGAQYARGATSIPGEAAPVVTQFLTRAYFFGMRDGQPEALWRDGLPWLRAVIDDGAGYHPPAGSSLDAPFRVVGAASNDDAMVVLGGSTTTDRDRPSGLERLPESVIWVSRDGTTFERIDPNELLPGRTAIRLTDVVATESGFVVAGTSMPEGLVGSAGDVVVLRSAEGAAWDEAAHLGGDGTPFVRRLFADGDRLVIDATDQPCDSDGTSYPSGLRTGVTRGWSSTDGGATWQLVDLAAAEPVIHQPAPGPCPSNPKLGDLIAISQEVDTEGSIVGLAGGALVARSRDGTTLGVSADLATWSQVALPEAVQLGSGGPPFAQDIVLELTGAVSLLALEERADLEGRPRSGGCQVRWWRSADRGVTWSTGPWGRPFSTCAGASWTFDQLLDGSVVLFANAIVANTNRGEASFRTGTPGKLIPWDTCVPGPKADCSFATLANPTSETLDWTGINLSGATITAAALDGVQLPDANAYAALLSGSFSDASLRKATLSYAVLEGDFGGADLGDANLFQATIRADLTGANLAGAELTGLTFGDGAVCPDGNVPTVAASDPKVACRL